MHTGFEHTLGHTTLSHIHLWLFTLPFQPNTATASEESTKQH